MYAIWNIEWQGYRPRYYADRHGGIFNAERFSTLDEAHQACLSRWDIVHEIGRDGIPQNTRDE